MKNMQRNIVVIVMLSLTCLISLGVSTAYGQWAYTYGGSDSDYIYAIQQTSDGGYIAAGQIYYSESSSGDVWVLKLNSDGTVAWQKTYGGSDTDWANSIVQTGDNGYLVAGSTWSFGAGRSDLWLLKLNSDGTVAWQKTYGRSEDDSNPHILLTSGGGFIVAGTSVNPGEFGENIWLVKFNNNGSVVWEKSYGYLWGDGVNTILETSDNGYILVGQTYSDGLTQGMDAWILKLDANGEIQWQKAYGGPGDDDFASVAITKDGGYIVAGKTQFIYDGDFNAWVLKLDSNGGIVWQKSYGGTFDDVAMAVAVAQDSGYIVSGTTQSFGSGDYDMWVMKLDISGTVVWERTYGAQGVDQMTTMAVLDDGLIIGGSTMSFGAGKIDGLIMKLDLNGMISPCILAGSSTAVITDTAVIPIETNVVSATVISTISDTSVTPVDTSFSPALLCPASLKKNLLAVSTKSKHDGHGVVTTNDGGILCPGDCKQEYYQGAHVILGARSTDLLSTFLGWSPASLGCPGTNPCWITMDKKKSVKALFQGPNKLRVAVSSKNGGTGSVTSGGNLISCPGDCEELYRLGASVTLTATPTQGYFSRWTGKPCKDEPTNVCAFTMDKNIKVKAIFEGTP